ncbi:MAG: pirin family protein [Flavobacteriaceae bacterium]|nr:pirin family protein [Flavobacteriaceae bacterium]
MDIIFHPASSRGFADHGWLKANHSFSFARFYDSQKMNFGALRVLNHDRIAPNMGFGTHPHDNMEIITIPISGILKHKDSMSEQWLKVEAGEVQVMSAGAGVFHSEMNASSIEDLTLFQTWILPDKQGVTPRYDQRHFELSESGVLQVLVESIDDFKLENSLKIHQDAQISRINLSTGDIFKYTLKSDSHGVYILQVYGSSVVLNKKLGKRDAVGISKTSSFELVAENDAQLLFLEVPILE